MKFIVLLAFVSLAMAEEYYTTKNDYLDVDAVTADMPRLYRFLDCFLYRGPCSELAESYKKNIAESVIQACRKCNSPQKHIFWKFLSFLEKNLPEEYGFFKGKYDPDNKYFDALIQEISKY